MSSRGELKEAVASAAGADVAAIMIQDDTLIASYMNEIVPLATRFALPLFSLYSEYVTAAASCVTGQACRRSTGAARLFPRSLHCPIPSGIRGASAGPATLPGVPLRNPDPTSTTRGGCGAAIAAASRSVV